MTVISLMRHELRLRRRTIIGWTIGLAFFGVLYTSFYPALPDEMLELDFDSIEVYKSMGFRTMATFDGYMLSSVFNFLPLLAGVFGIVLGVGALAGEEDSGTLELLASLPVSRLRLYVAKAAALVLATLFVTLVLALIMVGVFLALESEIDTAVTAADLFWVTMAQWLVIFAFLALGLFLGALMPSRGSALAAASAIIVVAFFGNNLAGMVTNLETLQPLSPFYHYAQVAEMLTGDVPWDSVGVLLAMGALPLVLGAPAFQRRDLTVGAWPWQRPRPGEEPSGGEAGAGVRSRRVVVPLAIVALVACCCVSSGGIALVASDDLRADVRDGLGLEDAVSGTGELDVLQVPVRAYASGTVESVLVAEDDVVAADDLLIRMSQGTGSARLGPDHVAVLEDAWTLLEELAFGYTDVPADDLQAAADEAEDVVRAVDRLLREAHDVDAAPSTVAELEARSELANAAFGIAESRMALAEDGPGAVDVVVLEEAMRLAESGADSDWRATAPYEVRAPIAGSVGAVFVGEGDSIRQGETLVRLVAQEPDDGFGLAILVSEDDAEKLEAGMAVDVDVDGFDDPFDGHVLEVFEASATDRDDDSDDDSEDDDLPYVVLIAVANATGELEHGDDAEVRIEVE